LGHWQKIGQFRNNHISIGAGAHTKISTTPYIFSRYYNKDGYEDKVVIVLGASGSTVVQVASLWLDGTTLRDFYSGQTAVVTGGQVTFVAASDTILIEEVK
jgi:alpha-amylase